MPIHGSCTDRDLLVGNCMHGFVMVHEIQQPTRSYKGDNRSQNLDTTELNQVGLSESCTQKRELLMYFLQILRK
jgi:hypothetical protein